MPPTKRRPGQSNDDYEGRGNPNAQFIHTSSLYGGGDPSWVLRGVRAILRWRDSRGARRSSS